MLATYPSHLIFPPLIGVGERLATLYMGRLEFSYSWLCVHAHEHFSAALRVETVSTLEAMTLNQRNAAQQEKENAELQKKIIEAREVLKQQEIQRKNESEMVQKCNTSLFLLPVF